MSYSRILLRLLPLSVLFLSFFAHAQTVITAAEDTYVVSTNPDYIYGTTPRLWTSDDAQSTTFVKFETAGLTGPVSSAILTLDVSAVRNPPATLQAQLIYDPWDETSVTYNSGTTYGPTSSDPVVANIGQMTVDFDVTDIVNDWLVSGTANNGIAIVTQSTNDSRVRFYSTENDNVGPDSYPRLTINGGGSGGPGPGPGGGGVPTLADNGDVLVWDGGATGSWVAARPGPTAGWVAPTNIQPFGTVHYIIALTGVFPSRSFSDPFIGQITMFGGNFAPRGWAFCDGQLLSIASNTALFSLLGTTYGGDGRTTMGLPDLRGRVPIHPGNGPGLSTYTWGQRGGTQTVPSASHTHPDVIPPPPLP